MPRTAQQRKRRRKHQRQVIRALPEPDKPKTGHGEAVCEGCNLPYPTIVLTSSGHCPTCLIIDTIDRDHRGGISTYRREEAYDGGSYQPEYKTIDGARATRVPQVGNGAGPTHWLDIHITSYRDMTLAPNLKPPTPLWEYDDWYHLNEYKVPDSQSDA